MQYKITATTRRIETHASERLSFDSPRHDAYRWELAKRIAELKVGADEMLHTSYCGPDDPLLDRFDIENILFYNVRMPGKGGARSCFSQVASNGVSFAYRKRAERQTVYEVILVGGGTQAGSLLINWTDIPIGKVNSDTKPWQVWLWINQWLDRIHQEPVDWLGREFVMEIGLGGVAGNFAAYVKPTFDGVISAFHSVSAVPPEIVGRVASQVGRDEATVENWLRRPGVIKISEQLPVYVRGRSVQWSPDDHLCTHGVLRPLPTASRVMQLRSWPAEAR